MTATRKDGTWHVKTGTQEVFGATLGECIKQLEKRSQSVLGALG